MGANVTNVDDVIGDDNSKNSSWRGADNTPLKGVTVWLMVYVLPIIFIFGILGNSISFIIFMSAKMRRVSTNIYLAALSSSNNVLLVAGAVAWTDLVGLKLMHQNIVCQATVFLSYCSDFVSVWLVVCVTVENFLINFFLRKASGFCVMQRAVMLTGLMCILSSLLYNFALWASGIISFGDSAQYCGTISKYQHVVKVFTFVDINVTFIIPTVLILALVVPTCIKILSRRNWKSRSIRIMLSRKERMVSRVTRLLCIIIVSFVVLSAPEHLNKIRVLFSDHTRSQKAETDMLVVFITKVFYYLSFSVNFIYFLFFSKHFRRRF